MASLLIGFPNSFPTEDGSSSSSPRKRKKIPKVAVYVAGAAFAVTSGLTLLALPYVRQAAKQMNPTQFVSNRYMARLTPRIGRPGESTAASTSSSTNTSTSTLLPAADHSSLSQSVLSKAPSAAVIDGPDPETLRAKRFNDREERKLYGTTLIPSSDPDNRNKSTAQEPISPFLGFQALGIATAIVMGCAGMGAVVVGWAMGVNDMHEFSSKMRESLQTSMPVLISSVNRPGRSLDGLDGQAIDNWVAELQEEDEREQADSRPS